VYRADPSAATSFAKADRHSSSFGVVARASGTGPTAMPRNNAEAAKELHW
jgi:hypothetical protein